MQLVEVLNQEYESTFGGITPIYNSPTFNDLNLDKVEEVKYLLFVRDKVQTGLIAGVKDGRFLSPFSAPFGGFSCVKNNIRLQDLIESCTALEEYVRKQGLRQIEFTIPPSFYDESLVAKNINALFLSKFEISKIDLNYHFDLSLYDELYTQRIWRGARKNLRIGMQHGLNFREYNDVKGQKKVYDVIQANRKAKRYPLKMTFDQIIETIEVTNSNFFTVELENDPIAAAIIFHVTQNIVQVIYWGHLPNKSNYKPINFLSNQIFKYFKDKGIDFVDIGPSTDNSIPNFGLCDFKESIGCHISPKFSFRKILG